MQKLLVLYLEHNTSLVQSRTWKKVRRNLASERKLVSGDLKNIDDKLEPLSLLDQEQFVVDTLETRFDKMKVKNTILRSASVLMSKQKSIAEQESVLTEFLEKKSAVNSMVEDYNELEVLVRNKFCRINSRKT